MELTMEEIIEKHTPNSIGGQKRPKLKRKMVWINKAGYRTYSDLITAQSAINARLGKGVNHGKTI